MKKLNLGERKVGWPMGFPEIKSAELVINYCILYIRFIQPESENPLLTRTDQKPRIQNFEDQGRDQQPSLRIMSRSGPIQDYFPFQVIYAHPYLNCAYCIIIHKKKKRFDMDNQSWGKKSNHP